jgi:hypothetical protein
VRLTLHVKLPPKRQSKFRLSVIQKTNTGPMIGVHLGLEDLDDGFLDVGVARVQRLVAQADLVQQERTHL